MDIQTAPIPKRLTDSQEVNRFLNLCEHFEKENEKEVIKEYASEALSRFNLKGSSNEDRPNYLASQGSRPLTISIRLSGTKEKIPIVQNQSQPTAHKAPVYRQLSSKFLRVNSRGLNKETKRLKDKRKAVLEELTNLRNESMSTFPLTPDPIRQKSLYDYFLEESVLVANDFIEERKWKIQVAYILAHEAQAFYYEHIYKKEQSADEQGMEVEDPSSRLIEHHKKIGHFLSSMVNEFWTNVKEAQNEVLHSKKNSTESKTVEEPLIQYVLGVNADDASSSDLTTSYINKPSSLDSYLDYCYHHHLTSVISCSFINPAWENTLYSVFKQIRFFQQHECILLIPEEYQSAAEIFSRILYPSNQHISIQTSVPSSVDHSVSPSLLIVCTSCLSSSPLPYDLSKTHIILFNDNSIQSLSSDLLSQLFHLTTPENDSIFFDATFTVPTPSSSQHVSRQNRQQKDPAEGGEVHLPTELHSVSLSPWQVNLRNELLTAIEDQLESSPSAQEVLQYWHLLYHQLEVGSEDWNQSHSLILPSIQLNWPIWLWSVLVPSPYQSILTSTYDIHFYSPLNLRRKEIEILLSDKPSSLQFNYTLQEYKPIIPLKSTRIQEDCMFDGLLMNYSSLPSLIFTEEPVIAETPCVLGTDIHYQWITRSFSSFQQDASSTLSTFIPSSSSSSTPYLVSSHIIHLLTLLSEGRKDDKKQLIICESKCMAYSIIRHCYKQGYHVIEIGGDPTNSNPCQFWNETPVIQFNHAPVTTIGLICLSEFSQSISNISSLLFSSPIVDTIYLVDKPKPGYSQQLYNQILFMLSTRKNANASVIEVFSELETRVSFSICEDEEIRENHVNAALRTMFNLEISKEKESRPSLVEIFDEKEWNELEEFHLNHGFVMKENEEFVSLRKESQWVIDMSKIDKQILVNEKVVQIQSILTSLPILSYCFSISNTIGIEISTLSSIDDKEIDIHELLNPRSITKQFEFPCYPVPPLSSSSLIPYPQTIQWKKVEDFAMNQEPIPDLPINTLPITGEPAISPDMLGLSDSMISPVSDNPLTEYTAVERSLAAWEDAVIKYHNENPSTEIDSFLYTLPNPSKNYYTVVPERYNLLPTFSLSFSVNKSSELCESNKNKRNRKRQRDGFDQEERQVPGSIGNYIHPHINRPLVWNQYEDEMLCMLVMQFGTSWTFICSVFLMEHLNCLARTRKDCKSRWEFLSKNKDLVDAKIPQGVQYLCIPEHSLCTSTNIYYYYSYHLPLPSPLLLQDEKTEDTHEKTEVNQEKTEATQEKQPEMIVEEEKKKEETVDKPSPFHSLFQNISQRKVQTSLYHPLPASQYVQVKLKERDEIFAAEESNQVKRLQCYLRPDPPTNYTKDLRRSVNTRSNMSGSSSQVPDQPKQQSSRVHISPLRISYPPNYKELRQQSINKLPLARISIANEVSLSFLLDPKRYPQQGIVIPFEQALLTAKSMQEKQAAATTTITTTTEVPPTESTQKAEEESQGQSSNQLNNGIVFDNLEQFVEVKEEENMNIEVKEEEEEKLEVKEEEEEEEKPEEKENCEELPPARLHYPYMNRIEELESWSVKREYKEMEETSAVNLKLQKIPLSTVKRIKLVKPSIVPQSFYTPVSQVARGNVNLLRQNWQEKKKQIRNPNQLVQILTTMGRKELNQQPSVHGPREAGENGINGYDMSRQRQANSTMYRLPQNGMQYPGMPMQQAKGNVRMNSINQQQQQQQQQQQSARTVCV